MKYPLILLTIFVIIGCSESELPNTTTTKDDEEEDPTTGQEGSSGSTGWLIPLSLIRDGGPGKDGIPALNNPRAEVIGSQNLEYLEDTDGVLAYESNGTVKGYSLKIMDWHEIANDRVGGHDIAITYCPLTGSGIAWGRELNGSVTTFGVSGLIFESNLIPYDRLTDSNWSQMYNKCVSGQLAGSTPEFFNLVQMNFGTFKNMFPESGVTTKETGWDRNYDTYPYGPYKTIENLFFPVQNLDSRLHAKELVRGVEIDGEAIAFRYPASGNRELIVREFAGEEIIVVSDSDSQMILSFINRELNGAKLEFSLASGSSSAILQDQFGNKWDVFGYVVEGPNSGQKLEVPYSYMAYWFAWAAFYPETELHEN